MYGETAGLRISGDGALQCEQIINELGRDEVVEMALADMFNRDQIFYYVLDETSVRKIRELESAGVPISEHVFRATAAVTYLAGMCGVEGGELPLMTQTGANMHKFLADSEPINEAYMRLLQTNRSLSEMLDRVFDAEKNQTWDGADSVFNGAGFVLRLLESQRYGDFYGNVPYN